MGIGLVAVPCAWRHAAGTRKGCPYTQKTPPGSLAPALCALHWEREAILAAMSEDRVTEYKAAYDTWQRHLAALHSFFLDKQRIDPLRLKGVLNREARSKHKYDVARLRLLGIEEEGPLVDDDEEGENE